MNGDWGYSVEYNPVLQSRLPETYLLLRQGQLKVHPAVSRAVLHGSRGPLGGQKPDSDVDISLVVDVPLADRETLAVLLQDVIDTSLREWRGPVELDLAAVFDNRGCGLTCFDVESWSGQKSCAKGGTDCFGLYKSQRGFRGFVENFGIQVRLMQPCLKIWERRPVASG